MRVYKKFSKAFDDVNVLQKMILDIEKNQFSVEFKIIENIFTQTSLLNLRPAEVRKP
jgi:hypothetical protein